MALVLKDRVRESTATTGTGTLSLDGAVQGFQGFSVIGNGNTTYYAIVDVTTGAWEVGVGTYTSSGQTLSRDTVLESSSGGTKINFGAGPKDVFCTYPAEQAVTLNDIQTLTNKTISGANNTLSNIGNASLTNSSITFGSTAQALGSTVSALNGVSIGASTASTGAFTDLAYTGTLTGGTGVINIGSGQLYKDASGNVGVGTSSPTSRLTVSGGAASDLTTFSTQDAASLLINNTNSLAFGRTSKIIFSTGSANLGFAGIAGVYTNFNGSGDIGGALVLGTQTNVAGGITERMRITNAGNVGIGTSAPSAKLDVRNGRIQVIDSAGDSEITITGASGDWALRTFAAVPSAFEIRNRSTGAQRIRFDAASDFIGVFTGGTERMRITSAGNVGIGTSSPAAALTVTRATTADMQLTAGATGTTEFVQSGGNGVARHVFAAGGQTAYVNSFDISQGVGGQANLTNRSNSPITFLTNNSERARIDSAGNVGIGTSSPVTQLRTIGQIVGGTTGFASGMVGFTGLGSYNSSTSAVEDIDALYLRKAGGDGSSVGISFGNGGGDSYFVGARIKHVRSGSNSNGHLVFETKSDASINTTVERMRITDAGNVGIGTSSPSASAILDAQSTTKGVRMPNMTTTQKNAIASPAAGLMVYDTTLAKLCVYTTAWETITSL
jgi:hypothetical protein